MSGERGSPLAEAVRTAAIQVDDFGLEEYRNRG